MNKKPILSKRPKKFIIFLLVCLITITLAGCDSSNKMPTGDIDLDAVYATGGGQQVTVGEVYNKLRYNAVDYLETLVYNFLYEEEIKTLTDDLYKEDGTVNEDSKYLERIENEILDDIYGTHDEEELEDLTNPNKNSSYTATISTYVDNMFKKGYVISADDVKAGNFSSVYSNYYLEVAKYIAAKNKLTSEFEKNDDGSIKFGEINDESYFTEDEVINWYENNYENTGDITAVLIRFINQDELTNVLKKFGLKQVGNKWYQIRLDIPTGETIEEQPWYTKNGYDKFYDEYKIDLSGDAPLSSVDKYGNGNATVLKIYAEIYNYVYAPTNSNGDYVYRDPIEIPFDKEEPDYDYDYSSLPHLKYYEKIYKILEYDEKYNELGNNEEERIKNILDAYEEENNETIVMSKEKLDKYSTSLTNYVYTQLSHVAKEEGKAFTQYSTSGESFGSYYYLVYKIHQVEDEELYEETTNKDDETEISFINNELLNEILNEMFEDAINDTYISDAFNERVKEAELKIFDSIIQSLFMNNSTSSLTENYKKNNKQNKDNKVVAEVTYKDSKKEITVKDLYDYLEPLNGPTVASTLLFQKYIKTTNYYTDLNNDETKASYEETIKLMLYYFANDYYSSSGYPSTIGKYDFMMLYFGTADVELAIDFLMVSDAMNAYFSDFTSRGFASSDNFYSKLKEYALGTYNDFYSLTVSGLTVYVVCS